MVVSFGLYYVRYITLFFWRLSFYEVFIMRHLIEWRFLDIVFLKDRLCERQIVYSFVNMIFITYVSFFIQKFSDVLLVF